MTWTFTTRLERFDVGDNDAAWQHVVLPEDVARAVQASGHKRFVLTLDDATSWHCAVNVTCEADHQVAGISFCYVSREHMKAAGCAPGQRVDVRLEPDTSKYGMSVHPTLEAALAADPELERRFDEMLPGKRRGHLLRIGKARTEATVAKRIEALKLELDL